MESAEKTGITVETTVNASIKKVWASWSEPKHITKWCQASEDWHAPYAENDLRTNGKFKTTMAAKDGSMGFDLEGVYSNVQPNKLIEYILPDERKVRIAFDGNDKETKVTETFDAENENPVEMQRGGWQAILDSFKKYTETTKF
ncbi:MAG: SRPBCC family protein [Bacteroidota bacterium]